MAAATVTYYKRHNIDGLFREVAATSVVFANSGDTWTVPGLKTVYSLRLAPTTNASYGFTIAGNVITLTAGSGLTFTGDVAGL